jgi:hypothetical protein
MISLKMVLADMRIPLKNGDFGLAGVERIA